MAASEKAPEPYIRQLTIFFVVAYVWSWSVFLTMAALKAPLQWTILGTMGPTIGALVAQFITAGNFKAFRFAPNLANTFAAILAGVALILATYAIVPVAATIPFERIHWSAFLTLSVFSVSTLLAGPLFEEPGWRGYALPRLQAKFGPAGASLLLGVLWAGWHLPLFLIPSWSSSPIWIYFLIVIGLSFIMTWGANLSGFSVICAIVMHAAFNTAPRYLPGLFTEQGPQTHMPFELIMALAGAGAACILIVATRGRLGARPAISTEP